MIYTEYANQRAGLLDEAREAINAGNMDLYAAKKQAIEDLDAKFDTEAEAEANLNALEGTARKQNISNPGAKFGDEVIDQAGKAPVDDADLFTKTLASEEYLTAWAKKLQGVALTASEANAFALVNTAASTSNNTSVIPTTIVSKIFEEAAKLYPYWDDVPKTFINGILELAEEDSSSDAAWYDEDTATADGTETTKNYTISGCELARKIPVKWKLKEMSITDFIPYITRKMARKMGAGLGYGVTHGQGKPGSGETFKPEPLGVVTALTEESSTPQIKTYTAGSLAYDDVTALFAMLASGYKPGAFVYANNKTIWNELASVCNASGMPVFITDPVEGGVGRLFGTVVKEDASMNDGEILLSNPELGYYANINKQLTVMPEEDYSNRQTNYHGYAIVDGTTTTTKAHALLQYAG